jgi:hypothetical protein
MLRSSKYSKNEVVAPEEEEVELDKHIGMINVDCGQVTK